MISNQQHSYDLADWRERWGLRVVLPYRVGADKIVPQKGSSFPSILDNLHETIPGSEPRSTGLGLAKEVNKVNWWIIPGSPVNRSSAERFNPKGCIVAEHLKRHCGDEPLKSIRRQ
jgi:hypothetical protein